MNENKIKFKELSQDQARIYNDTVKLYEATLAARKESLFFKGSMCWKKSKEHEYLFQLHDRYGHGKSLGRRSVETEKIFTEFKRGKEEAKKKLSSFEERIKQQAKFCKAIGIHRVPSIVTRTLRLLEKEGLLGDNLVIVGANTLYGYEAASGVRFENPLLASKALHLLQVSKGKLPGFSSSRNSKIRFLNLLRKVDKSFQLIKDKGKGKGFRGVNKNGYSIGLFDQVSGSPWKRKTERIDHFRDPYSSENKNLKWLVESPVFSSTVIGKDGLPARMVVPDPKYFVLHKIWLSRQEDRDPLKRVGDQAQAEAVAGLIDQYFSKTQVQGPDIGIVPPAGNFQEIVKKGQELHALLEANVAFEGAQEDNIHHLLGPLFELNKTIVSILKAHLNKKKND